MDFTFRNKEIHIDGLSDNDHIYKTIADSSSFYELDLLEYIRSMKSDSNTVCIDVGGNIGNHSIYFGNFIANHVITIEPNSQILPLLKKNLENNLTNFHLYDCAVGASNSYGTVIMPENAQANAGMAKVKIVDEKTESSFTIRTLDKVFDEWLTANRSFDGKLSFIKIDVEGMEIEVLKGATNILEKNKPDVFAEAATHDYFLEINHFLADFGYVSLSKWAATPVYHFAYKPSILLRCKVLLYKLKLFYWDSIR